MGEGATSTPQLVQAPSWLWTMAPSLQASIFQSINTYSEQEEVKADGHICSMWRGQMEGSRGTLLTKSALGEEPRRSGQVTAPPSGKGRASCFHSLQHNGVTTLKAQN